MPQYGDALALVLTQLGCEVRVARSGTSALAILESFEPQLVTLDIELGDTTGFEVARAIRAQRGRLQPYLVAITCRSEAECGPSLASVGFDRYLQKPVAYEHLEQLLHAACQLPATAMQ
jgi:CheY-like chemotaxis protein